LPCWYVPAFIDTPPIQAIYAAASAVLCRVVWEYIHLFVFQRTGWIIIRSVALVWAVIIIGYAAAYSPLFVERMPVFGSAILFSPLFIIISMLAGLFSCVVLLTRTDPDGSVLLLLERD